MDQRVNLISDTNKRHAAFLTHQSVVDVPDFPSLNSTPNILCEWLNALVEEALKANPDLQSAKAALRAAQENLAAQRADFFPTLDGSHNSSRTRNAKAIASPLKSNADLYSLHTSQLVVSYMPDVFGGVRRQVESTAAQTEAARFEYEAAYLTLTSSVVNAAIQEAALRAQV